jgi:CDP-glycerol glycerophosphotransferase
VPVQPAPTSVVLDAQVLVNAALEDPTTTAGPEVPPRPTYVPRVQLLAYLALVALSWLVPKNRAKVLLHSPGDLEDGILAVADELATRGVTPTVLLEDPSHEAILRRLTTGPLRTVPLHSPRAWAHFLTARYVMSTESVFGGFRSPPGQISVNLWHGEPPTKPTGRFGTGRGLHSSISPVCSTVGRAYRSAEFGVHPHTVPIIGAPRNDRMLRACPARTRNSLLGGTTNPAYLWMPSFRVGSWGTSQRIDATHSHPGLPFTTTELRRLDQWLLGHQTEIWEKLHPRDLGRFPEGLHALHVLTDDQLHSHGLTTHTALNAFDGLITDMSSIWVDYLLLDKPLIFAFPDIESYREGRGLNLEPYEHWIPGPLARTIDDLTSALTDLITGTDTSAAERHRARLRFHQHTDDHATSRLFQTLQLHPAALAPS